VAVIFGYFYLFLPPLTKRLVHGARQRWIIFSEKNSTRHVVRCFHLGKTSFLWLHKLFNSFSNRCSFGFIFGSCWSPFVINWLLIIFIELLLCYFDIIQHQLSCNHPIVYVVSTTNLNFTIVLPPMLQQQPQPPIYLFDC
jgi:hypothetical protein